MVLIPVAHATRVGPKGIVPEPRNLQAVPEAVAVGVGLKGVRPVVGLEVVDEPVAVAVPPVDGERAHPVLLAVGEGEGVRRGGAVVEGALDAKYVGSPQEAELGDGPRLCHRDLAGVYHVAPVVGDPQGEGARLAAPGVQGAGEALALAEEVDVEALD